MLYSYASSWRAHIFVLHHPSLCFLLIRGMDAIDRLILPNLHNLTDAGLTGHAQHRHGIANRKLRLDLVALHPLRRDFLDRSLEVIRAFNQYFDQGVIYRPAIATVQFASHLIAAGVLIEDSRQVLDHVALVELLITKPLADLRHVNLCRPLLHKPILHARPCHQRIHATLSIPSPATISCGCTIWSSSVSNSVGIAIFSSIAFAYMHPSRK